MSRVSTPAHRDSRWRDGGMEERDKLFQVRGEGNASVGHAIATVLWLMCACSTEVLLEIRSKS